MQPTNLLQAYKETVERFGDRPCLRFKEAGQWQALSWKETYAKILDLAGGLRKLGVGPGDRVSLFSKTRYEWTLTDWAVLACGAVTVPIYESNLADQAGYIIDNSGSRVVFVENDHQLKKILSVRSELPTLKQIIVIEPSSHTKPIDGIYSFDEVLLLGAKTGQKVFDEACQTSNRDTVASYVYTSGTTGHPKGAILTQGNFLSEVEGLSHMLEFVPGYECLLFLPLAHILARAVQFSQIHSGFVLCYAESIDKLLDNIAEVKPHVLPSVPRIFEKVYDRVLQGVESSSDRKKKIFNWALGVGRERARYDNDRRPYPLSLKLKWKVASSLVFSKLHQKMGGRIKYFISGGAPLCREIGDFFEAAGFLILEGYGLTETTGALTLNTKDQHSMGTVGKCLPGVELKIAGDGEILARGGVVFQGYYKNPDATAEVINAEGWFHTGDIGVIDEQGMLKITDRKKDIIVTAAGKNVAPQNIENLIKADPIISQVMVHGDRRKFLSALVTLNQEEVVRFAREQNISFSQYGELIRHEKIYNLVKARIDAKNKNLAKYETIKKFAILEQDFSVETGELTPTLKVKRKFTSEKYQSIIEQFYQEQ